MNRRDEMTIIVVQHCKNAAEDTALNLVLRNTIDNDFFACDFQVPNGMDEGSVTTLSRLMLSLPLTHSALKPAG